MYKKKKQSPFSGKLRRSPGQKLHEDLQDVVYDDLLVSMLMITFLIALGLYEWFLYLFHSPRSPWIITIIALITIPYFLIRIFKGHRRTEELRLGRDGEKYVGQKLEELRALGAEIFHDIPADGFNLDHVVLAPSGIYCIETKSRSKKGSSSIRYDGKELYFGKAAPDSAPIEQVQAESRWLKNLLFDLAEKRYNVQPVLIFPTWYIEYMTDTSNAQIWVMNENYFLEHLKKEAERFSSEELRKIASLLRLYLKQKEAPSNT